MIESIINGINAILSHGIWGAIILLPIAIVSPFIVWKWAESKYSIGACGGHPENCKLYDMTEIMTEVRRKIDVIKIMVHSDYAMFLPDYIYENKLAVSSQDIGRKIALYEHLLDSSFMLMERELRRMFVENHIPLAGTHIFDEFVDDRFGYIWSVTWDKFDKGYGAFFVIPHKDRKAKWDKQKEVFKKEFRELLMYWEEIRNA